jgi:hypothetical protein
MCERRPVLLAAGFFGLLLAGCTTRTETKAPAGMQEWVTVYVDGMTKVQGIT